MTIYLVNYNLFKDICSHVNSYEFFIIYHCSCVLLNVANVDLRGIVNSDNVRNYHGTVQLYNQKKNRFEYICDEGWDINDAHVICHMLGFPGALDATLRSQYGEPYARYASFSNVQCTGNEDSIFDCPYEFNSNCIKSRSAGVQCLSKWHDHNLPYTCDHSSIFSSSKFCAIW